MTDYWFDRGAAPNGSLYRPRSIVAVSAPAVEPIDLPTLRTQARIPVYGSPPGNPEDAWISGIALPGAREWVEAYLRRTLVQRVLRINYDRFPPGRGELELLMPPVIVVQEVRYFDQSGTSQVMAPTAYIADVDSEPARLVPAMGTVWPVTALLPNAVSVTYKAGYPATGTSPPDYTAAIPVRFKHAIAAVVADLYANREKSSMMQLYENCLAESLLYQDRVVTL